MKLSKHNGRVGKNGVYNPKHNDRRFDIGNSEHIDTDRSGMNVYWDLYQGYRIGSEIDTCEIAGLKTMPVIVRKLDDDEAIILMVDANIQRENILPSERARSLKMKYDVLKRQGKRTDLTSGHYGPKLTATIVGDEEGISQRQVKRFIRLNNLIPELLDMTDIGTLGFVQAVDVSFVPEEEQYWIYKVLSENKKKLSAKQSAVLKQKSLDSNLSEETVCEVILGHRIHQRKVTFTNKELSEFFPEYLDEEKVKQIILELLENWKGEIENYE